MTRTPCAACGLEPRPEDGEWRQYIDLCWLGRQHHQRIKVQILLTCGTIFSALLAATGLVRADGEPMVRLAFPQSLLFIGVFAVAFFYYKYQAIRIFSYDLHRELAERNRRLGAGAPTLTHVLAHRDHCSSRCPKWLLRLAGLFILAIWVAVAMSPVMRVGISGEMLQLHWQALVSLSLTAAVITAGSALEYAAKNKARMVHRPSQGDETARLDGCARFVGSGRPQSRAGAPEPCHAQPDAL